MKGLGFDPKEGKHLAFLNNKKNYFVRSKTLGLHYTRNSIKYRIENKDFKIQKFNHLINTKKIDTTQQKYRDNYGLRKWATKKNIIHLEEISDLVFNKRMSLEEIKKIQITESEFVQRVQADLGNKDSMIYDLTKKENAFKDYRASASLIANYKRASDKGKFKSQHYQEFKKFDNAKKNMYFLKRDYGITSDQDLFFFKERLENERKQLYKHYVSLQKNVEHTRK